MGEPILVKTGIAGLDEILHGGIPAGNIILVRGVTGAGKTLFGVEFIYRGITEFGEPGIIVLFETSPGKLVRDAAAFGWHLEELQQEKKLQIVFTSPQVLDQELRSPESLLLETAREIGAQRIFIDGVGLLHGHSNGASLAPSSAANSYRGLLQQLMEALGRENLTGIVSHGHGETPDTVASLEAAGFLSDTVIQLDRRHKGSHIRRTLEILKSRGQDFDSGPHALHIIDGKGLRVFRRVQSPVIRDFQQPTSRARRSLIGVTPLDNLIGGGVYDGSATMVIGISGAGKTVLGTQILREGALRQNRRGLLVSLDEHPTQIVRNAESMGLNLQEQIEAGTIHVMFDNPQELCIDAHYQMMVDLIQTHHIQRVVIDGMSSYMTALGDLSLYRDFVYAFISFTKYHLITTFFNYENPEFLGMNCYMPDYPVTSIVDNIILMNFVEIGGSIRRCLTVVKARGCNHESDIREYVIEQGGIRLLPPNESISKAAVPFANFSGLLGRAPTRLPYAPDIPLHGAK